MKFFATTVLLILLLISFGCMKQFSIPDNLDDEKNQTAFGAGDTTFLQLNPVWDSDYGILDPTEISIAQDGRIFIADSTSNSIIILDQNGNLSEETLGLNNLKDQSGADINPIDVDVDQKMNVFFIDGSQRIFVWNLYWNQIGIKKVSVSASFEHIETGLKQVENTGTDNWFNLLNSSEWQIVDTVFSNSQLLIDSLLNPYLFYNGSEPINQYLDLFYDPENSRFTGISAPAGNENLIYVSDNYGGINNQFRLLEITFQRSLILELTNGQKVWCFKGIFGSTIKGYGTGAGTVNKPLSIEVDYENNLYYTQSGDFFPVHKLIPNLSGDFAVYISGFQPGLNDIMDASLFGHAYDVAVDQNKFVYVADGLDSDIIIFDSYGNFFKEAGYIPQDSANINIMDKVSAIAVDNRGVVYVCDRGSGSVFRFVLSSSLDDDIIPKD